jgi:hypothetical protein
MRELWRRSFDLFRKHLILWIPCVSAGLLSLALVRLEKVWISVLVRWLTTRHSVLGGDVVSTDPSQLQNRTLMVTMPLGLCREFLDVCFFVVALVMTSKLVSTIFEEKRPDISSALKETVREWREILLFSLKYMVALGAIGAVIMLSTSTAMISHRLLELAASKAVVYPVVLALEGAAAWLLMPSAVRLLQTPNIAVISTECRRLGTISMVLMSAVALVLQNIIGRAEAGVIFDNQWELSAVSALNTVVENAPEVLLFIVLALLSVNETHESVDNRGSRVHGILQAVMPMHFRQSKDPK